MLLVQRHVPVSTVVYATCFSLMAGATLTVSDLKTYMQIISYFLASSQAKVSLATLATLTNQ